MNISVTKTASAGLAAAGLILASATTANAFDWSNITQNGNPDIASQIQMTVSQQSGGEVDFSFRKNGSVNSVITAVYLNYGTLFTGHLSQDGANWIVSSSGVSFADSGTANFPGGNSLTPKFVTSQSVGATAPPPQNGIQNSTAASGYDSLTLKLQLDGTGPTFAQLIDGLNSGGFEVGLHVQSIGPNEGSDSYVTAPVPEPTTVLAGLFLLLPFGITTMRFLRRRKIR